MQGMKTENLSVPSEYAAFQSLLRKVVKTEQAKPKPSASVPASAENA